MVSDVFVNVVCDAWNGTVDRAIVLYRLRADHDMRGITVSWLNTLALRIFGETTMTDAAVEEPVDQVVYRLPG